MAGSPGGSCAALLELTQIKRLALLEHGDSPRLDLGAGKFLGGGLRQIRAKTDVAGRLVIGERPPALALQLRGGLEGRSDAAAQDHEGEDFLAPDLIGHRTNGRRENLRVSQ